MGAAVEAKRITREALDRNREKLALEQRQQLAKYEQERVLELEREDMVIRDAKGEGQTAAEARLCGLTPTGSPNTGHSPGGNRPSAAPASSTFSGDSNDDPSHLKTMGADFFLIPSTPQVLP